LVAEELLVLHLLVLAVQVILLIHLLYMAVVDGEALLLFLVGHQGEAMKETLAVLAVQVVTPMGILLAVVEAVLADMVLHVYSPHLVDKVPMVVVLEDRKADNQVQVLIGAQAVDNPVYPGTVMQQVVVV
jgi:hypothetical protein